MNDYNNCLIKDIGLALQSEKIKNTFLISSLLRDSRGNNFELIIDNFELERSDLTLGL